MRGSKQSSIGWQRTLRAVYKRLRQHGGILLVLLALLLYASTLDNGLQPGELHGGDLITHQYAQVQARPSNAPGYPLYTMGGWLWFHGGRALLASIGYTQPNPIPILSSYSTLWALLALWLLYRILCQLTTTSEQQQPEQKLGNRILAWLLSAFFGVTYFFWYYATTTEQYSSAVAHTLAIVYVYLLWRQKINERPSDDSNAPAHNQQPTANSLLFLLALLCGLSLAHMLTVAFIVPAVVALVLWDAPHLLRRPRVVAGAVGAAALPLLSYVYVYLRGAAHPEWWGSGEWTNATEWFWSFISTAQGREELSWGLEPGRAFWGGGFPELMWQELSLPLFVLGLLGIAFLGWRMAFLLYTTLLIYFTFCWLYRYGNWFQVILPAYPLMLMGIAGLATWGHRIGGKWKLNLIGRGAVALLLLLAIGWRVNASLPGADSRNRPGDTGLDRAALLLDQPLPAGALLFAAVDDALALDYLIHVWGIRPDVRTVDRKAATRALEAGTPVYVTTEAARRLYGELRLDWQPAVQSASPDWARLSPPGGTEALPGSATPLGKSVMPGVTLLGYSARPGPTGEPVTNGAPTLDVTLYWRLASGWPSDLAISLRPTQGGGFVPHPSGEGIVQRDVAQPVSGLLGLGPIPMDATVADAYRLPVEPRTVDGLALILYRATDSGFENVADLRWELMRFAEE